MSQVLANPESSSPPKNNYPLKVDTSKLISLSAKIRDIIDILNKCHTDPRFINSFAPGDFAEKRVLKLVEWFSGHSHAIKS